MGSPRGTSAISGMRIESGSAVAAEFEEATARLCQQAKLMSRPCDPQTLSTLYHSELEGNHGLYQGGLDQQSKDAVIYVTVIVVFYIAIVALLIGTNLRGGVWWEKGARFKRHIVEFEEGEGATDKIVTINEDDDEEDEREFAVEL